MTFSELRHTFEEATIVNSTPLMNMVTDAACELTGSTRYVGATQTLFTALNGNVDFMNATAIFLSVYIN